MEGNAARPWVGSGTEHQEHTLLLYPGKGPARALECGQPCVLGLLERAEGISGAYEHMTKHIDIWLAEGGGGVGEGSVGLEQRVAGCCWSFKCTAAIC